VGSRTVELTQTVKYKLGGKHIVAACQIAESLILDQMQKPRTAAVDSEQLQQLRDQLALLQQEDHS
jgi:hypothetical protein